MKLIRYLDPLGNLSENPEVSQILEAVHSKGEKYWNSHADTGFATLSYFQDENELARLVFSKKDSFGFHVNFCERPNAVAETRDYFCYKEEAKDKDKITKLFSAGEFIHVPKYLFLDEKEMENVLKEFFRTGKRSKTITWIEVKDLKWDVVTGCPV